MISVKDGISISEMARIHGLTRQTLIYYDNIGLFKPERVDSNGYRYYSWAQIPYLREICFLKHTGIPLKKIQEHFQNRTPEREVELLNRQRRVLECRIGDLQRLRGLLNIRIENYEKAIEAHTMERQIEPFLEDFEERRILFRQWDQPINRTNLHRTVMALWQEISERIRMPVCTFGTLVRQQSVRTGDVLAGAGSIVFLPPWDRTFAEARVLPGGKYACMYKYGMPYEEEHVHRFLRWIDKNGLELAGDIVDACLLDTTFYQYMDTAKDFCMLQALVRKKGYFRISTK